MKIGGTKNKTIKTKKTEKWVSISEIENLGKEMVGEETTMVIPKTSISFLIKMMHTKTPEEFRQIAKENDLYIPLNEYPENKEMFLYLIREILELAINATRDGKKKSVSSKIIEKVIENDPEFNMLFLK